MLTPRLRSLIFVLAIIVVILVTLSSSVQPSTADSQNVILQLGRNNVLQTTATNTTSTATNKTGPLDFIFTPIVASVKAALAPYIGQPPRIPLSTLFTIGMAVLISLASASTGKLLVDYDMVKQTMREFQAYQRELNKAKKENDTQTVSKLMKKQQAMTKLQARASMEQMKVTAVTFVPFLLLWYLMSAVLGGVMVAQAPFPLTFLGTHLVFWQWYFLCNFAMSLPMYKIFGIGMSDN